MQSTSITNSTFLFATVATPIGSAYSLHSAYRPYAAATLISVQIDVVYKMQHAGYVLYKALVNICERFCLTKFHQAQLPL
jgi:hypothetical protein